MTLISRANAGGVWAVTGPAKTPAVDYLSQVDGLRAIAILTVLGFHLGVPGFSGGFVGVDVFFVISGYLIIGQVRGQLASGNFSLYRFFERRALRLLPALFLVLLFTALLGSLVLATPSELEDFGRSLVAASVMSSNVLFWATQGYFETAAEAKPLLHTWSLGVEAQFYLLAPLILLALRRLSNRKNLALGVLLACISLSACLSWSTVEHNAAFYLMPFRAWEFLAGALAGDLLPKAVRLRRWLLDALAATGFLMIASATYFFSSAQSYPTWRAAVPVAGAVLLLAASSVGDASRSRSLLSLRPLVFVGLVSYGWYLWHWPLVSLWRLANFERTSVLSDVLVGGLLGFVLACLSYWLVERPIAQAKRSLVNQRRGVALTLGLASAALAAASGAFLWLDRAPRVEAKLDPTQWPTKASLDRTDECAFADHTSLNVRCRLSGEPTNILLVGDSHARESYPIVRQLTSASGVQLVSMTISGCAPLFSLDILYAGQPQGCTDIWSHNVALLSERHARLDAAIVQATWSIYVGGANGHRAPRLLVRPGERQPLDDQYAALSAGLRDTLDTLRTFGVRRILVITPPPQFDTRVPDCLLRTSHMGLAPGTCGIDRASVEAQRARTLVALRSAGGPDVRFIDPFEVFCESSQCVPHAGGLPLFVDDNHMSRLGTGRLFNANRAQLDWLLRPAAALAGHSGYSSQ